MLNHLLITTKYHYITASRVNLNIVESVILLPDPVQFPLFSFFGVFVRLMCLLDVWFSTRELLVCVLNL